MSCRIPLTTIPALLASYDIFLLDAFGVLVDGSGVLPGAPDFLEALHAEGKIYLVLTNDASRLPSSLAKGYEKWRLRITEEQIVTAGALVGPWIEALGLASCRAMVLGPPDSSAYAEQAGATIVPLDPDSGADVVMIGDEEGYDLLTGVDAALSVITRARAAGRPIYLVCPNPDVVHPKGQGKLGISSGGIAALIEHALAAAGCPCRFARLGKPDAAIFTAALARFPNPGRVVMIGDQLTTDIRGAQRAGIDSVLVGTGIGRPEDAGEDCRPTWYLPAVGGR